MAFFVIHIDYRKVGEIQSTEKETQKGCFFSFAEGNSYSHVCGSPWRCELASTPSVPRLVPRGQCLPLALPDPRQTCPERGVRRVPRGAAPAVPGQSRRLPAPSPRASQVWGPSRSSVI